MVCLLLARLHDTTLFPLMDAVPSDEGRCRSICKHSQHPGGQKSVGGMHCHGTDSSSLRPGAFGKVGMRCDHGKRNQTFFSTEPGQTVDVVSEQTSLTVAIARSQSCKVLGKRESLSTCHREGQILQKKG